MAAAAYGRKAKVEQCLEAVFPNGAFLIKYVEVKCPIGVSIMGGKDLYNCAAFLAMATSDKAIILSFRGTDEGVQIVDEIFATIFEHVPAVPAGIGYNYFVATFWALTEHTGLLEEVWQTMSEYPDYELWITGHSLGATVASFAAAKLVKEFNILEENLKLVTFGQPRTGNTEWAREMDNIIKTYKYRVVSGDDVVPLLPPKMAVSVTIPWPSPIGSKTYDFGPGTSWLHSTGEVWYPGGAQIGAQFKMCNQTNEQEGCSAFSEIAIKLIDYIFGVLRGTGVECAGEVLNIFKNIFNGFDAHVKWEPKWPWEKNPFPEVSVKMPSEDEIVGDIKKCFERKFQNGLLSGKKIEELFPNFKEHHTNNFGLDYKGEGDSGCNKMRIPK